MMDDNGRGGLLRRHLEGFAERDPDLFYRKKLKKFFLVLKIRAGRIPEAVTRTLIPLTKDLILRTLVLFIDPQITTDQKMRVLRQGFGGLHRKPVKVEIFRILVRLKKFLLHFGSALAYGHSLKSHNIKLAAPGPEKIRNALIRFTGLPRECETHQLTLTGALQHDKIISFRITFVIAVDDLRLQDLFSDRLILEPLKKGLHIFLEIKLKFARRPVPLLELPLSPVKRDLVDPGEYLLHPEILEDPVTEERRLGNGIITVDMKRRTSGFYFTMRNSVHTPRCRSLRACAGRRFCHLCNGNGRFHNGFRFFFGRRPAALKAFHDFETGKSIAAVMDRPLIGLREVAFHKTFRKRCAAANHRDLHPAPVHFLKILFHDQC